MKIDWKQLECEVIGVANDGLEGKRLVDELKPDIVISDIVMPGMTGLELAGYINANMSDTVVIILTAYNEFKYAQQAIKYNVRDYILKPIDKNQIIKAVKGAIIKIRSREHIMESMNKMETMVKEARPLITTALLFDIALYGNNEIDHIRDQLQYFDIGIENGAVIVFQLEAEAGQDITMLLSFASKSIMQSVLLEHRCGYAIKEMNKQYIILVSFEQDISGSIIKKRLIDACKLITDNISENIKLCVSAGIGKTYSNIYGIHDSYQSAVNAVSSRFFKKENAVIHADDVVGDEAAGSPNVDCSRLYEAVGELNEALAVQAIENIFIRLGQTGSQKHAKSVCTSIIEQIERILDKNGVADTKEIISVDDVNSAYSLYQLQKSIKFNIGCVCKKLLTLSRGQCSPISKALQIINKRYSEKELSLQSIANELNISLSHLSRLFRKEMDTNFMDYITEIRINKARELLDATEYKTPEVADKVGFYDFRYFGQVFRKKCGMTPGEYKQRNRTSKN